MHESLKRPLFRKKAMEVYQARYGGIKKFVIGGAVFSALGAAGRFALPYLGRAVASGARGVDALGKFTQRPKVAKTLLGLEGAGAASGVEELRRATQGDESLYSDQPATYTGGLAALYGGVGYGGRSLKAALPQSARAQQIGSKISLPAPFLIPTAAGFVASGEPEFRGTIKNEGEIRGFKDRNEYEQKMQGVTTQLEKLGQNANQLDVLRVIENYDFTDKQKEAVYVDVFNIPKEQLPNLRTQLKGPKENLETTKDDLGTSNSTKDVENNFTTVSANGDPSKMSPNGQDKAAVNLFKQQEAATKKIKEVEASKAEDESWKREYSKIRNSVQEITNSGDMTNLVLLQLASGLLSGKTTQRGLSGFADVLGQASGPAIQTAIALASQQKEFDTKLALNLLEQRGKQGGDTRKIESQRVYVQEQNPDDPFFPTVTVEKGKSAESGRILNINKGPGGEEFTYYEGRAPIKKLNEKRFSQAQSQMENQQLAIDIARTVVGTSDKFKGAGGTVKDLINDTVGSVFSLSNVTSIDEYDAKTSQQIRESISNPEFFADDTNFATKEEKKTAEDDAKAALNKFMKDDEKARKQLQKALKSGDAEKEAFATLAFVENRAKYVVANANKAQDRLALKDITDAEKNTGIFGFKDPAKVNAQYKALIKDMNDRFKVSARTYVNEGGAIEDLRVNYKNVPYMRSYEEFLSKKQGKQSYKKGTEDKNIKQKDIFTDLNNFDNLK